MKKYIPSAVQHNSVSFNYKRESAFPIDTTLLWNELGDAKNYAMYSPVSYDGQIIAVKKDNKWVAYTIDSALSNDTELCGLRRIGNSESIDEIKTYLNNQFDTDISSFLSVKNNSYIPVISAHFDTLYGVNSKLSDIWSEIKDSVYVDEIKVRLNELIKTAKLSNDYSKVDLTKEDVDLATISDNVISIRNEYGSSTPEINYLSDMQTVLNTALVSLDINLSNNNIKRRFDLMRDNDTIILNRVQSLSNEIAKMSADVTNYNTVSSYAYTAYNRSQYISSLTDEITGVAKTSSEIVGSSESKVVSEKAFWEYLSDISSKLASRISTLENYISSISSETIVIN